MRIEVVSKRFNKELNRKFQLSREYHKKELYRGVIGIQLVCL